MLCIYPLLAVDLFFVSNNVCDLNTFNLPIFFPCSKKEVLSQLHFSQVPVFNLGNWIPQVFYYWGSVARNYVLAQVSFTFNGK